MSTCDLVAESVWKDIESNRIVTDDQLAVYLLLLLFLRLRALGLSLICIIRHKLHFLFGKNFERATNIVDQRGVKTISGEPSCRSIFQVVGESRRKEEYLCYAEHYCACYSFFYDVVNQGEQLCCKHQFAARLAVSTGACVDVKVSDVELALLPSKV